MQKYVHLVYLVKSFPFRRGSFFQRLFACKNWRRYSRERASQSLEVIQFICSFASLCESNLARQNVIVRLPLCNGLSFDLTFILRERLRSFDPRLYAAMRALRFVVLLAFVLARRVSRRQIGTLERPELEASGVPGSRTVQA